MGIKKRIKSWVSIRAESCKSVAPLFSHALDRKLTLTERLRMRFHLMLCTACTNYVANIGFLRDVFHAHSDKIERDEISTPLSPAAKARIKEALKR